MPNFSSITCDITSIFSRLGILEKKVFDIENDCCGGSNTCSPVKIVTNLSDKILTVGDLLLLSISVSGTSPFTYQWKKDGSPLLDAINSSYRISSVVEGDSGVYSVEIFNACGTVSSNDSIVVVNPLPTGVRIYWGWVDDIAELADDTDILNLQETDVINSGDNITADFTANDQPKILVIAQPVGEPLKVKWFGTQFNQGFIGNNDDTDLFPDPVTIGSFSVYFTNYLTQQTSTTIQFLTS